MAQPGVMMRVYVSESDKHGHEALYKFIVKRLRERGIAGATAYRGEMGYGAHSVLLAPSPLRLSQDLPVVVEAVDSAEAIERVLPEIEALVTEGLVLTQEVTIRKASARRPDG